MPDGATAEPHSEPAPERAAEPAPEPAPEPAYDERGLAPCIVQDAATGAVLMLAWMNAEALRLTRETSVVHFWSRSRGALWKKGETSGNTLAVGAPGEDSTPPAPPT